MSCAPKARENFCYERICVDYKKQQSHGVSIMLHLLCFAPRPTLTPITFSSSKSSWICIDLRGSLIGGWKGKLPRLRHLICISSGLKAPCFLAVKIQFCSGCNESKNLITTFLALIFKNSPVKIGRKTTKLPIGRNALETAALGWARVEAAAPGG